MNQSSNEFNDLPIDYHHIAHEHDYYDVFKQYLEQGNDTENSTRIFYGDSNTFRGIFALVSRVGFIFIQAGSIPVENVYSIIIYNIVEIPVVLLSYGVIGNWFAFGSKSSRGWIGYGEWSKDFSFEFKDKEGAIVGFCGCLLATAQMSTFLLGRINLAGGMVISIIYSSLFQSLLMHWIWHEDGWMRHATLLGAQVSVKDYAGALALHIPSTLFGTIGALFLGRRVLLLKDIDRLSFGTETVVTTLIGYLLIIFNYIIFALPTQMYKITHLPNDYNAIVAVNSLIAIGGGAVTVIVLQIIIFRGISSYRRMIRCIQGSIAGLIMISACVDIYTPGTVIILSLCTGLAFFFFSEILHKTALEDPCSFISSHLICGFIGMVLCPLIVHQENFGNTVRIRTRGVHVLWQFICTLIVIGLTIALALVLFFLLTICQVLRNDFEVANHKRAVVLRNAFPKRAFLERLFAINTTTDYVAPGYNEKYFGSRRNEVPNTNTNTPRAAADKINEKATGHEKKGFNNPTVMYFQTDQIPLRRNTSWQTCASGEYYDRFLKLKSFSSKESTNIFIKHQGTSCKGYNEV